jgi:hypothetical protein
VTSAQRDTEHLQEQFGSSFAILEKVDLETHTLNVFEIALLKAQEQGRAMQTIIPILACLYHDFGKSSLIRNEILGQNVGRGYKGHAEVSQIYINDIFQIKFSKYTKKQNSETIFKIGKIVAKHHPSTNKEKNDLLIKFVSSADSLARKQEIAYIKQNINKISK